MINDFYIDGVGSGTFGVRLLSSWSVGSAGITRTRTQSAAGMRFLTAHTAYDLLTIKLPVHITGDAPHDAAELESKLKFAMLAEPVELTLPDGFYYTASLESMTDSTETSVEGRTRSMTFTLVGYRHSAVQKQTVESGNDFFVNGTFPAMECRITVTAGADTSLYYVGSNVYFTDVEKGDVLVVDGLTHTVTRNGENDISNCDIVDWAMLYPGTNNIACADSMIIEYYPIWI